MEYAEAVPLLSFNFTIVALRLISAGNFNLHRLLLFTAHSNTATLITGSVTCYLAVLAA